MSFLTKSMIIVGIIAAVVLTFVFLREDERGRYFEQLGDKELQNEAVIGLFLIKEDLIPFLAAHLRDGLSDEMTEIGIVRMLGKKYGSVRDERIEQLFREVLPARSDAVKRAIYKVVAESRNKEVLDIVMRGLKEETDTEILVVLLENMTGFGEQIQADEVMKTDLRAALLKQRESDNERIRDLVRYLLGFEVKRLVDEAQKEADNFNFTTADLLFEEARGLSPDNILLAYALGKYYMKKKNEIEQGEAILEKAGYLQRVPHITVPPVIDGEIGEEEWKDVPSLMGFYQSTDKGSVVPDPATIRIDVRLACDRDNLYMAAAGFGNYNRLIANAKGRDSNVWEDDCCEIFFDPDADESTYYQIICNFEGTIHDASAQATPGQRWHRPRTSWNGFFKSQTFLKRGEYWSVEFSFPWKMFEIDKPPADGDLWGFNFSWVKQAKPAQYAQWSPTYGSAHQPWYFGYLKF